MDKRKPTEASFSTNQASRLEDSAISKGARKLTAYELAELRRDMADSSAKMQAKLARRRNDCLIKQDL